MNKRLPFFVLLCLCACSLFAQTPNHVVISQVYGGGGNTGAPFNRDFVELYNPTNGNISLTGWSLQYAGGDASNWSSNRVDLSGTIKAGHYFLIELNGGNNNGVSLPAPDFSSNAISMAAIAGKVALVNNTTVLSGTCPTGGSIVDFVGYGSAKCFEGGNGTVAPDNSDAVHRKGDGCTDTDDNEKDFFKRGPSPRNSTSLPHFCGTGLVISTITPQVFCVNASQGASAIISYTAGSLLSGTVRAYLSDAMGSYVAGLEIGNAVASGNTGTINITIPANAASGTGYFIRLHASSAPAYSDQRNVEVINGAKSVSFQQALPDEEEVMLRWTVPSGCYDEFMVVAREGSAPTANDPAGDGSAYTANQNFKDNGTSFNGGKVVYKGISNEALTTGLTIGRTYFFSIYTRRGLSWSSSATASTLTRTIPKKGEVLINAFSSQYAGTGDEYVELVNTTGRLINLADLNLSYQGQTGNANLPTGLSGNLEPYSFWLLSSGTGVNVGQTNLDRDGSKGGSFTNNGHVAITRKKDNAIIDAVAYGNVSGGTFIEGNPALGLTAAGGIRRKMDGVDTDNNSNDFEVIPTAAIDLRNKESRLAREGAEISATASLKRIYITGNAQIKSSISLTEKLVLQSGKLALNEHDLNTQNIEGGTAASYVQTNGTGALKRLVAGATPVLFPVGRSTYNPVTLLHPGDLLWRVNVSDAVQAANAGGSVQRTWDIAHLGSLNTGATITFQYDESDVTQLGPVFDGSDKIQAYHQHGGVWQKAGDPVNPAGPEGGIRTVTLANWTQFSPFVLSGAAQAPLPIKFAGLRLFGRGTDLVLQFTVHNETGVDHYKVETSADGHNWEVRALLEPQSNSGGNVQYEFADQRPLVANRYYRVQGVEQTGLVSFSGVAVARGKVMSSGLQVAPNPVVGTHLQYTCGNLPAGKYTLRIYNGAGQAMHAARMTHAGGWLSGNVALPNLKGGWYVLELAGLQTTRQTFLVR
jgi:hypothetical protein